MRYYKLKPEVAGQIGPKSKLTYESKMVKEVDMVKEVKMVKEVIFLEYVFYGWLGDELLTSTPCFIITKKLKQDIVGNHLTGFQIDKVKISFSQEYLELGGSIFLPKFVRLKPIESYEENKNNLIKDFYYNECKDLIVSERALQVISQHKISMCVIEELK